MGRPHEEPYRVGPGAAQPRLEAAARFFTKAELELIYAACHAKVNNGEGPQPNPIHAHVWRLLANTGLRRGEALALRWEWINGNWLRVPSTEERRTKSGKWREVPLTEGAMIALFALPMNSPYVLPRIAPESLSRAAIRDIRRASLLGSIHTFRHTYISHLVMAGEPLRADPGWALVRDCH